MGYYNRSSSAGGVTAVAFASPRSTWCFHPLRLSNPEPPSPLSSSKPIAVSTIDLVVDEFPFFPMCIILFALPFSSDPLPPRCLSIVEPSHRRWPSSSTLAIVSPLLRPSRATHHVSLAATNPVCIFFLSRGPCSTVATASL